MEKVSVLNKIRSIIGRVMQRTELIIRLAVKFFGFLFLFKLIAGSEMFAGITGGLFNDTTVQMVMALVATLLPSRCGVLIALVMVVYNVFQSSLIGAVLVGLMLMLLYAASSSLFPDETFLLVLVPVAIHYHWLLAVPLICGMFMDLQMSSSLDALPQMISEASENGLAVLMDNNSLPYLMVFMAAVILLTAVIKKLQLNYTRYIALAAGSIFGLVMLILGRNQGRIGGDATVIWRAVFVILGLVILELLKVPLSYKGAQILEFEDESYVYKVKVIPKMSDAIENRERKKERARNRAEGRDDKKQKKIVKQVEREQQLPPDRSYVPPVAAVPADSETATQAVTQAATIQAEEIEQTPLEEDVIDLSLAPDNAETEVYQEPEEVPAETLVQPTLVAQPVEEVSGETQRVEPITLPKRSVIADDEEPTDLFNEFDEEHR